jgi:glucokinase
MLNLILALDFGGTKLTAATVTVTQLDASAPAWRVQRRQYSPPDADVRYDINTMLALARAVLDEGKPAAVGVSFGGPVDFESGTVRLSHHVPGWENTPLRAMLAAEFDAPTIIDNDANAAALGEHRFGAGQGCDDLMYITVSTGVGGGWVLNGRPWRGYASMAGEIGHTVVDPEGPRCLCGKRGCIERLASGPYMAQDLEAAWRAKGSPISQTIIGGNQASGETVADAAEAGDEMANQILERGARALGVGIGNAANLINPKLFLLGGGVTKAGKRWWTTVRQAARETALPEVVFAIEPAGLGKDAPLWGAVALAMEQLEMLP